MITYLILANIFLVICYAFYHFLLRRETFFQYNRLFLLSGLFLAFLLPLVDLVTTLGESSSMYHMYLPAVHIGGMITDETVAAAVSPAATSSMSAINWLGWMYGIGCAVAGLVFLYKLAMTIRLLRSDKVVQGFSFFGKIHVDKTLAIHRQIETHETVHAKQWHSLDVIFMEIVKIFNWFNPVVYLYERALKLQHEYLADRETAIDGPVQYAETLMSAALGVSRPLLTTPFAESRFLKKRIQMLLKAKSKKTALAKYVLVLPAVLFMLAISTAFSNGVLPGSQENQDSIRQFREEIGRNTMYPASAIGNGIFGDVMALFDKRDGDYETLGFLSSGGDELSAALKRSMEVEHIKKLAPEGKNAIKIQFRIMSDEGVEEPRPLPEAPPGYRHLDDVLIVGFTPVRDTLAEKEKSVLFESVEVSPEPPNGLSAFRLWIGQNYVFPQEAIDEGINGTIEVSFVVEVDGSLSDIRVLRDLKYGTGDEAVRLLKTSPKWAPGIQNGRPVRVAYTLPIRLATQ